MHTHMLRAAFAALVVLLPVRSVAQAPAGSEPTRTQNAQAIIGQLLSQRMEMLREVFAA
jgi:hypothetical protein